MRIKNYRLLKQTVLAFKDSKNPFSWNTEVAKDLELMGMTEEDIWGREKFRENIKDFKGFPVRERRRIGSECTDESRKSQSARLKAYWAINKAERRKNKK